ncbi:MAG: LytR C-terminal domain-containing protein, partial [Candidatus Eremiobacteraeota bacterium]|nr:LytR C-terminal domain-containing protein [Candidatus Eremiobacteraeota bacterium]
GYGDSLVPDTAARTHLVATMLLSPPSPIPSPDAMALAAISPGTLRVDVENGSGVTGAASRVATVLRAAGFTIGEVGDADRSDYGSTVIRQHSNVTFAGAKVRSALPRALRQAAVVPDASPTSSPTRASSNSDVTVIVGSDAAQTPAQDSQHHS